VGRDHATHNRNDQTIPVPPHLHRRTPLCQPMPPSGRVLLLPSHHPQASREPTPTPQPPLHLRPATTGGPLRHPVLHRRSPPPHRLQRHRPSPRRPTPLWPPDRQPQPAQDANHHQSRRSPNRRRDHPRPHPRRPGPARRSLRHRETQKPGRRTTRAHHANRRRNHLTRTHHHPRHPGGRRILYPD
jgi:hypothetical protein